MGVLLVTGGRRGIGAAIAKLAARYVYDLALIEEGLSRGEGVWRPRLPARGAAIGR